MIYFDHAATTPLDGKVLEAMLPYLREAFGNPSSVHSAGREARAAVERARGQVALTLNADPKEIVFTSGGTESVNAVQKGVAFARRNKGNHLILSSVEHSCVRDSADWLARNGFQVDYVPVNADGRVDPRDVEKAVRKETILISVMAANNEVGTIQPFREIGRMARERSILFHVDAVQAYGKVPIDVKVDPIDFLSVSAHKIYGPKGAGFHYQRLGVEAAPLLHGGGQERDLRGGTENVAGIVGLGEAAERICRDTGERTRLKSLAAKFLKELRNKVPQAVLNGPAEEEQRLPGIVHLSIPGVTGESLVDALDARGFSVSSGAACAAGSAPPSRVLLAMGRTPKQAKEGLRLSFGHSTTEEQARKFVEALPEVLAKLKEASNFLEE